MDGITIHPIPTTWKFSKHPLKSKTDMAAMIGLGHQLPVDLKSFYPILESDDNQENPKIIVHGSTSITLDIKLIY